MGGYSSVKMEELGGGGGGGGGVREREKSRGYS